MTAITKESLRAKRGLLLKRANRLSSRYASTRWWRISERLAISIALESTLRDLAAIEAVLAVAEPPEEKPR
jgi:hypothetical protein